MLLTSTVLVAVEFNDPLKTIYSVSQTPLKFSGIFSKQAGIFWPNFTCLLLIPTYVRLLFLCNYLQLWQIYAILSATTQFTPYAQNVYNRPKCTLAFCDIFPKQLEIFSPNFTHLLHVPIYVRLQILVQLSPTETKLCHIKCDHPACVSAKGGHFEHIMVVALNMA